MLTRVSSRNFNIAETQFTQREIAQLRTNFDKACRQGMRSMVFDDFQSCLGLLGSSKTTRGLFASRLFEAFSKNGRMGFDDFVQCMGSMLHADKDEKLKLVFTLCARHGTATGKVITKNDLKDMLVALHELFDLGGRDALEKAKRIKVKQDVIDSIYDKLDVRRIGHVEWNEFRSVVRQNPDLLLRVEGDVTLPGQRLVDSIALATKVEHILDKLKSIEEESDEDDENDDNDESRGRHRTENVALPSTPKTTWRHFKLLVHFNNQKVRCDLTRIQSFDEMERKLRVALKCETARLQWERQKLENGEETWIPLRSIDDLPTVCKIRGSPLPSSPVSPPPPLPSRDPVTVRTPSPKRATQRSRDTKKKRTTTKMSRHARTEFIRRAHILSLRLLLSLQQLRVDVGAQLEIDDQDTADANLMEPITLTPPSSPSARPRTRSKIRRPSTAIRMLDKEWQRLAQARANMESTGELLDELISTDAGDAEVISSDMGRSRKATEEFDTIMPGDMRWNTVLTVMKGIQLGAARSQGEAGDGLRKFDFFTKDEYRLESFTSTDSSENSTPPVCTFVDFAPRIFYALRRKWGISTNSYINSVGYESMYRKLFFGSLQAMSGAPTKAAGGGFFFFSADGKYLIKSLDEDEFSTFFKDLNASGTTFLQAYYDRISDAIDNNGCSLLCQFCGLHQLKNSEDDSETYLVVMRNVFCPDDDDDNDDGDALEGGALASSHHPSRVYDLKGSVAGRTNQACREWCMGQDTSQTCPYRNSTMKDIDFLELGESVRLSRKDRTLVLDALAKDAEFLSKQNVMDYSLVVGIYRQPISKQLDDDAVLCALRASRRCAVIKSSTNQDKSFFPPQIFEPEVIGARLGKSRDSRGKKTTRFRAVLNKCSMHPGLFNNWKRKVFEIRNCFMLYFDQKKVEDVTSDDVPNSAFNIHNIDSVTHKDGSAQFEVTLMAQHFHKKGMIDTKLNLVASSSDEAKTWVTELRARIKCLGELRQQIEFPSCESVLSRPSLLPCDRALRFRSIDNSEYYRFGVIDLFTKWTLTKKGENAAKSIYNRADISAVPPPKYRDRFLKSMCEDFICKASQLWRRSFDLRSLQTTSRSSSSSTKVENRGPLSAFPQLRVHRTVAADEYSPTTERRGGRERSPSDPSDDGDDAKLSRRRSMTAM